MKKLFILCLWSLWAHDLSFAQLGLYANYGSNFFSGDIGQQASNNLFGNAKSALSGGLDYKFSKYVGIGLEGTYGKIQGTDNTRFSKKNFQSPVNGGCFLLSLYLDSKISERPAGSITPFFKTGIGYVTFDPHGDLLDKDGVHYVYWNDGSIRNLSDLPANEKNAVLLKRDYNYETRLSDSSNSYARNTLYVPLQIGGLFKLSYNFDLNIHLYYNLSFTDYMDNTKSGGNDSWYGAAAGIRYTFRKKPADPFKGVYEQIDLGDEDKDGIIDYLDNCLGTPKGIKVNSSGCPDDTDNDGFADYRDKEQHSDKKAVVDVEGVTINEDEWAKKQLAWDSLWAERSEAFNNAPSLETLKKIEEKGKELKEKTGRSSTPIPADLQVADLNKDGYISVEEINKTIDGFFEGENQLTVEGINRLIDFFFEQ